MGELYGALEAGGTKFVCAVGTGPEDLRDVERFPTTTPEETLGRAAEYFRRAQEKHGRLTSLGIGSFGPLDLDPRSPGWGHVTATPKPHWSGASLAPYFARTLDIPVRIDTDVNAAAWGEYLWGAGQGWENLVYVTVGTGIGGGVISGGKLVHGLVHPELGHQILPRRGDDPYQGGCPFHGNCLEGLAAGPALKNRWGRPGNELPPDHPAWDLEAYYLALGAQSWILTLSPQKIIFGGGVFGNDFLLPLVQKKVLELLGGYVKHPLLTLERIGEYLTSPGLGERSGILGSLALAKGR